MTGFLTPEEVFERLTKLSSDTDGGVIDDVYDLAQKQLAAEDVLSGRLDARATSLFGAVGFSMTVAFSFGGWALLDNARKVPYGSGIAVAFVGVLLLGLVTSAFALAGLKLSRGHVVPDEQELFDRDILWPGRKRADYRIFVAVHLWRIWQQRYERNERRARRIVKGQILFFMFLLAILLLSVLTTLSAIRRPADPPTSPPVCNAVFLPPALVPSGPQAYSSSSRENDAAAPETGSEDAYAAPGTSPTSRKAGAAPSASNKSSRGR